MDVQIIHYQMDGLRFRILKGQLKNHLCELNSRAIRCGECEMAPRFWLYRAENIGCAAAFIFVVSSRFPSRLCWRGRADRRRRSSRPGDGVTVLRRRRCAALESAPGVILDVGINGEPRTKICL